MLTLRTGLLHHLRYNHFPAVSLTRDQFEQVVRAIQHANDGDATLLDEKIIEAFHLDDPAFIDRPEL